MTQSFNFEKFLYTYLIFLAFITFIIGLGASDLFGGTIESAGLTVPTMAQPVETGNGLIDWINSSGASMTFFFDNLALFFTIMTLDTSVGWLGTLVFTPAIIFIAYGILSMIRGT